VDALDGKVAVVTGAASGIGLAMVERFVAEGMRVVMADLEREALDRASSALRRDGYEVMAVPTDVTDPASVEALAEVTRSTYGVWHVVCNNAGVQRRGSLTWDFPASVWDWVLSVNLMGVIHGVRAFMPAMIDRNEGHMVNVASQAALLPVPGIAPYTVSKFGVLGLSETIYLELAELRSAVKVSVLCPGPVRTNIASAERNWLGRLGALPERDPAGTDLNQRLARIAAVGADPATIGELVVDAIRRERFWIFSHPEYLDAWVDWHIAARDGRNPPVAGIGMGEGSAASEHSEDPRLT
jgi:NAD(P)-dependent dehydrogenase (short-subunit alcohol dehydrogenase family)